MNIARCESCNWRYLFSTGSLPLPQQCPHCGHRLFTVVCDETQRPQPLDQDPPVECPGQTDLFGGEAA
jgi:predicted  nucleic acid-binding Zn-ribbon protein